MGLSPLPHAFSPDKLQGLGGPLEQNQGECGEIRGGECFTAQAEILVKMEY